LSPPVGERPRRMTQGGTIPRTVPAGGDPDTLQSLREEIVERLNSSWRDVRLRLLPTEVEHGSLMGIGLTCVRLYNELNYEKRQEFFKGELTRDKMYEIDRRYYYKCEDVMGVNAQAVIQKNNEAWKSFFELLKLKKRGRLLPHTKKVSPPGYWKDRFTGRKEIHIFIRSDRYHLEPVDENRGYLVLEDFGLRIRYGGVLLEPEEERSACYNSAL
jgi:putative transposase